MEGNLYGYVRVSTREQNEDRQLIAIEEFGVPAANLFRDKESGKDFDRPMYRRLIKTLESGDTLVIKSIDRLGRNYDEIIEEWRKITKTINANIVVLDMPILSSLQALDLMGRLIADIVLYLMSYFAHMEREFIRQRQAEGIAAAKLRGTRLGRKPMSRPAEFETLLEEWREHRISARQAAKRLGIDHHTFLKWAKNK